MVLMTSQYSLQQIVEVGQRLLEQEHFTEAIALYELALKSYPATAAIYQSLGLAQEKINQIDASVRSYRQAIALDDRSPAWVYLALGKLLEQQNAWQDALFIYQQGIFQHPAEADLYCGLGLAHDRLDNPAEAISGYRRAVDLQPGYPLWVYTRLKTLLEQQQDWIGMTQLLGQAIEVFPNQADFYRDLGLAQAKLGDLAGQIRTYQWAIALAPQPVWMYIALVDLLREQGEIAQAIEVCAQGLAVYPNHPELMQCAEQPQTALSEPKPALDWYYQQAEILHQQKRYAEARQIYQQAIQQFPDQSSLYRELGVIQEKLEDTPGKIISYQTALALEPHQPSWLYIVLSRDLRATQQLEAAATVCQQGLQLYPEEAQLWIELGLTWERLDRISEMVHCYDQAIRLEPHQPVWVYSTLVYWLIKQDNFPLATSLAEAAIALYPDQAISYEKLADVLFSHTKRSQMKALEMYYRAIELSPDNLENYYKILEIRPNDTKACLLLSHALEKQGQMERAAFFRSIAQGKPPQLAQPERHPPEQLFDWRFYTDFHPDLSYLSTYEEAYSHWIKHGQAEGRPGSVQQMYERLNASEADLPKDFNYLEYLEINPDLKNAYKNNKYGAIAHYIRSGRFEGRRYAIHQLYFSSENVELIDHPDQTTAIALPLDRIAVLIHVRSWLMWLKIKEKLSSLKAQACDLIFSIEERVWTPQIHAELCQAFPRSRILIACSTIMESYLALMGQIHWHQYEFFMLLHGEDGAADPQTPDPELPHALRVLLDSPTKVQENLDIMRRNPSIGLLASRESITDQIDYNYYWLFDEFNIRLDARRSENLANFNMLARLTVFQPIYEKLQALSQAAKLDPEDSDQQTTAGLRLDSDDAALQLIGSLVRNQNLQFYWQD